MKELRILLAGGLNQTKFEKSSKTLVELLEKEGIKALITVVNTYEQKDLASFEDLNDVILLAGTNKIESKLPIVNGMGLVYAWMEREKMINELKSIGAG